MKGQLLLLLCSLASKSLNSIKLINNSISILTVIIRFFFTVECPLAEILVLIYCLSERKKKGGGLRVTRRGESKQILRINGDVLNRGGQNTFYLPASSGQVHRRVFKLR